MPSRQRHLNRRYIYLEDAVGAEITNPSLWFDRVLPQLRRHHVAYLVVGALELRSRPRSLLDDSTPVPWLRLVSKHDDVVVWQVVAGSESKGRVQAPLNPEPCTLSCA